MEEEKNLGGIGVSFCEGEEVEVVMSDVEVLYRKRSVQILLKIKEGWMLLYVDTLVGEAGRHGGGFLFGFAEQNREFLNCRHGDVSAIVPRKKGLDASAVALGPGV